MSSSALKSSIARARSRLEEHCCNFSRSIISFWLSRFKLTILFISLKVELIVVRYFKSLFTSVMAFVFLFPLRGCGVRSMESSSPSLLSDSSAVCSLLRERRDWCAFCVWPFFSVPVSNERCESGTSFGRPAPLVDGFRLAGRGGKSLRLFQAFVVGEEPERIGVNPHWL